MTASASAYIGRGMAPELAVKLAALVEGTALGKAHELIGLGCPHPLANELIRQMVAGGGGATGATNLMGLGMPPDQAVLVAADIEATDAE